MGEAAGASDLTISVQNCQQMYFCIFKTCEDADDCAKLLVKCQDEFECKKSCAQRRRDRVPFQARELFKQAAAQPTDGARLLLLRKAKQIIIEHGNWLFLKIWSSQSGYRHLRRNKNIALNANFRSVRCFACEKN